MPGVKQRCACNDGRKLEGLDHCLIEATVEVQLDGIEVGDEDHSGRDDSQLAGQCEGR